MFDDLTLVWKLWGIWREIKGGTMDAELMQKLIGLLIPVLAPLLTAGLKKLIPKLPKLAIVILQPILGILISLITPLDPVSGGVLGALGMFVREGLDQGIKTGQALIAGTRVPRAGDKPSVASATMG